MIGALVALLSLDMTRKLVAAGMVFSTFNVTDASNTTPIVLQTDAPHELTRPIHAVVSGVVGNDAANGVYVLTPDSSTSLTMTYFTTAGAQLPVAGSGTYVSGGLIQFAFPDGAILLGAINIAMETAVVPPRIVFVPIGSPAWGYEPAGGYIPTAAPNNRLAALTDEQKYMLLHRQIATEFQEFDVYVTGAANPPDPFFGDFDVTQAIYQSLYGSMFNLISPSRALILSAEWRSQRGDVGKLSIRGQQWVARVQIHQYVSDNPLSFIPNGTVGTINVNLVNGASSEAVTIIVPTSS